MTTDTNKIVQDKQDYIPATRYAKLELSTFQEDVMLIEKEYLQKNESNGKLILLN